MIFTHVNVDLDAVASVWAVREFVPGQKNSAVEHKPANWDGSGMTENDIAVDIGAGGKGIKGEKTGSGIVHSSFVSIVKQYASTDDQMVLENLVKFVDAQDAYGNAIKFLAPEIADDCSQKVFSATSINAVLRAFQAFYKNNDAMVVERMSEIFSGLLIAGRARQRARKDAEKAEIIDNMVAIVKNSKEFATNGILFEEKNIRVIVFVDGNNLGVTRNSDENLRMDHPDIQAVVKNAGEESEWFAHSAGFLYCRGSRKAPATTESKVSPRDLANAVVNILKK